MQLTMTVPAAVDDTLTARAKLLFALPFLWPPYGIGQAIIFFPVVSFFLSFFLLLFSSPNLSGRRLDVYHTSTHGVALVRI